MSTIAAQATRLLLTVVSGPVLARLIGPVPYGVLAPAQSVGGLGNLLSESGFAYFTVTAKKLSAAEARHLHRQSVWLSSGIALCAAALAASFAASSVSERLVRAGLAIVLIVLSGVTAVPFAWAQRNGKFAHLEWWGVSTQAASTFVFAIPLAAVGLRVGAAATNLVLPAALSAFVAWRIADLRAVRPEIAHIPRSYRLGSLISNFGGYLAGTVDIFILSEYLPAASLGVYTRALLLASLPGTVVAAAIARVGLVSLSQSDRREDHFRFLWKATAISVLAFSLQSLLGFAGVNVTAIAFGPKFSTAPTAFAILTLSQVFFYACSLLNTYIIVRKQPIVVGVTQLVHAALAGTAFLLVRPTTIFSIAWILLIPAALNYLAVLIYVVVLLTKASPTCTKLEGV